MENKHIKNFRKTRSQKCRSTEHWTQECHEEGGDEQKAMTEIEEMTLQDESKSYRVVVEGSCNNSNCWLTCNPPLSVHQKEKDAKHSITFSMFLKTLRFQHDYNISV